MTTFSEVALGELVELKRGYDLPAAVRRPGGVPVVSSRGITGRHDRARVPAPGVVTGRTGTLGGVYFVDRGFWPLNTTLYVRDFRGNDPRFVAYLLETVDFSSLNDKAAIPGVNRAHLHRVAVARPPLSAQRAISRALARLDRRRALLSAMDGKLARLAIELFRRLPPGPPRRIEELCDGIGNGGTPARRERAYWNGDIPWFRSGELDDAPLVRADESITTHGLAHSNGRCWPKGTVLVALYASPTVGRLGQLHEAAAANQACCALVAKPEYGATFLFHALLATRARLRGLAVGAAQQNINQKIVRRHEVAVPPRGARRDFERRAGRLHAVRAAYRREARALQAWRDALLPELVSGRLSVS